MGEFPESVIRKAAEVRIRQYESEYSAAHLTWRDFAAEVTEILDAVAEDLGQVVAGKIRAHMEDQGPSEVSKVARSRWRRHFGTAARVAAFAFLTDDDKRAIAARELAAGNAIPCFDGATDERETRLKLPRSPVTGRKMNPADVVGPAPEDGERP